LTSGYHFWTSGCHLRTSQRSVSSSQRSVSDSRVLTSNLHTPKKWDGGSTWIRSRGGSSIANVIANEYDKLANGSRHFQELIRSLPDGWSATLDDHDYGADAADKADLPGQKHQPGLVLELRR
jgi:hypothetical protein